MIWLFTTCNGGDAPEFLPPYYIAKVEDNILTVQATISEGPMESPEYELHNHYQNPDKVRYWYIYEPSLIKLDRDSISTEELQSMFPELFI